MGNNNDSIKIKTLDALNPIGCDDYFICCASFEQRCLRGAARLNYKVRYSIIFVIEEPLYEKEVMDHLEKLKSELLTRTTERIFTISCQRQNPMDGIAQLKEILRSCQVQRSERLFVTLDISGFTKIYLLELLHYLVAELKLVIPRFIHTTQYYRPSKLTRGVEEIVTMPSFFGDPSTTKQTLLVLFLGFEPERALTVWENFYPFKTIALLTNPPRERRTEYLKYAKDNNSYLLSLPSVDLRDVPPDNPASVRRVMEGIYNETRNSFNMIVGPFGTKSQVVGIFLFWLKHPEVQIVYSFPVDYTKSYLRRKPGSTLLLQVD